jgi:uncharacterized membrane protein
MKSLVVVGIVLIVLGLVGVIYGGITYTTKHQTRSLGPVEVTFSERERLYFHPALAAIVLAAGLVVFAVGVRNRNATP